MDFQKILQNKPLLIGIGAGVAILLAVIIIVSASGGKKGGVVEEKIIHEKLDLLTTDSIGKAVEIQAMLSRQGITVDRVSETGTKIILTMKDYKESDRDKALLSIVRSGMVDEHTGLEIFDKGDFTSTKDDKKIRLIRAINGELSRLIRKLPSVENAAVFISIPPQGQSMFTSEQKQTTATVQLSLAMDQKLDKESVKAITNLIMGSVQDIQAENISITDTNGHVYNSIVSAESNMMSLIEESDQYMKQKVQSQLDRLVGKGKYVVTVSTYLRESNMEKSSILYDPKQKTVTNAQRFSESLGDQSADQGKLTSAVTSYLPDGMPQSATSSQDRNYNRSAEEVQYGVSKTQITSYEKPGTLEEISIAVTLEEGTLPPGASLDQLKELIARAASPKVNPQNVTIVFSSGVSPYLADEKPLHTNKAEDSGNPWWTIPAILLIMLLIGLAYIGNKVKAAASKQEAEINSLRDKTKNQEHQLKDVNARASALIAQQEQIRKEMLEAKARPAIPVNIADTFSDLREELDNEDDEEISAHLASWIESSN